MCCFFTLVLYIRPVASAVRAQLPGFEAGISVSNIERVAQILMQYNYHGPLALAWDDMALEPAISLYQKSQEEFLILGSTDGPIQVTESDMDGIEKVFEHAQADKADKVGFLPIFVSYLTVFSYVSGL